jgi:hypothetical protein
MRVGVQFDAMEVTVLASVRNKTFLDILSNVIGLSPVPPDCDAADCDAAVSHRMYC